MERAPEVLDRCVRCGYDLRGVEGVVRERVRCPECGTPEAALRARMCATCGYVIEGMTVHADGRVTCPECGDRDARRGSGPRGEPLDVVLLGMAGLALAVWAGIELCLTDAAAFTGKVAAAGILALAAAAVCFLVAMRRARAAGLPGFGCSTWGLIGVLVLVGVVVLRMVAVL